MSLKLRKLAWVCAGEVEEIRHYGLGDLSTGALAL
tara:strand:+ start:542 stop:646 length:105 start_codon:yes stop_codon:yes gene_type:complete